MSVLLIILSIITLSQLAVCKNVTISNTIERRDVNGEILRVQDGCLQQFGSLFYLYGVRYQCCDIKDQGNCYQPCAWKNMTFSVYTSPDLQQWTLGNDNIFPMMTNRSAQFNSFNTSFFEPCVLHNAKFNHYVLWFNHPASKGTAISDNPLGPFTLHTYRHANVGYGSDAYFWVDPANPSDCYVKHNIAPQNPVRQQYQQVTKLEPDWLSASNLTSDKIYPPTYPVPPVYAGNWPNCSEGGGIFSHDDKWFVMFGACCCFCHAGSNAYVFVSDSPLGPYIYQGQVIEFNNSTGQYDTKSQQFSVAAIQNSNGVVQPVYIGQRFGSALDGKKCHDFQYWHPIQFDSGGSIKPLAFIDEFTIDIP